MALGLVALLMAVLVARGLMTPWLLLGFTFVLGTGAAFIAPAWQAVIPRLVPREELSSAIALNSMGINVSRAIGPALGALLIVGAGLASPFLVNALSVVGVILVLWWWRPVRPSAAALPPEAIGTALRVGIRYAVNSTQAVPSAPAETVPSGPRRRLIAGSANAPATAPAPTEASRNPYSVGPPESVSRATIGSIAQNALAKVKNAKALSSAALTGVLLMT